MCDARSTKSGNKTIQFDYSTPRISPSREELEIGVAKYISCLEKETFMRHKTGGTMDDSTDSLSGEENSQEIHTSKHKDPT